MNDYFEIDLLAVETGKSGDAIAVRYQINGQTFIHVVDGGFLSTGTAMVEHINQYYGRPSRIDHVVATHNDGDHSCGLREILESFQIGTLWMLRPWQYASELIGRFPTYSSIANLTARLRQEYSNLAELEEIAIRKGITIREPFQGAQIGTFTVLAPSKTRFLELILASERTPKSAFGSDLLTQARAGVANVAAAAVYSPFVTKYVRSAWGVEIFSPEGTSAENEMSVVQYANLCGDRILLTGDAGRGTLTEAADFAPFVGLTLPGISRFQVPHHGSRRNVDTELLDRWLGPRLSEQLPEGNETFTAMISSALEDKKHPRKAVIRAMHHRGGKIVQTEGTSKYSYRNSPNRGWGPVPPVPYPWDQEE